MRGIATTLCALLGAAWLAAPPVEDARAAAAKSLAVIVPYSPTSVAVEGQRYFSYELRLTNVSGRPLTANRVRIFDAATRETLADFGGTDFTSRFAIEQVGKETGARIAPERDGIVYLDFSLTDGKVTHSLCHEIGYAELNGTPGHATSECIAIGSRAPANLGPPLTGGPWVAIHASEWTRGHRRMIYAVDGRARIPGRFAIDFVRVGANGATTRGDPDRVTDTLGYGADVLAVADAVVAGTRTDMRESATISARPRYSGDEGAGNYVMLRLLGGQFAFYEHLKPGSVRVRRGDRVRRGQVIGALGFTGDTTGPHLHFHVADAASPLGAEGIPFTFERFTLFGRFDDIATLGSREWTPVRAGFDKRRTNEWPASNTVVDFGRSIDVRAVR